MSETTGTRSLAGRGYMRQREPMEAIPESAIRGYYRNYNNCTDPVEVGNYVVEQADLTRIRQDTGRIPRWMVTRDYSGSFEYLHEIRWTVEEMAAAGEICLETVVLL